MKKKIKIGISILLLIMISVHVSYAIGNQNEREFFKVNKEEISPEEILEMTFDISSLEYDKFKILLKSNVNSEDIYAENQGISIDNNENAIGIDIDKENIGLTQIKLYYPIPKEMAIGTKLQFTAQIIVNNEIKEENEATNTTQENTIANELEINNSTPNLENEINSQEEVVAVEITKTITVVEKKAEDDKNKEQSKDKNQNNLNENGNEQDDKSKIPNTEKNNFNQKKNNNQTEKMPNSNMNNQKISNNANMSSNLSNSDINNKNQAIYKGSNNNYLSKLEIDGIELNTSFNKENENYFIDTSNTNTINIVAIAEDSTAKINIAGNDTIQNGNNKILISVTAENGDVRYYRIFVNCEEGTDET